MPGMGYEGVVKFVMDIMTSYGINACPPLLVGIGVDTSIDVASLLSKKALMRPLGSANPNGRAALTEKLLEDGINKIGLGPQGMSGASSVMGVHIENCARHPSVIAVAVISYPSANLGKNVLNVSFSSIENTGAPGFRPSSYEK